MTKNRSVLVSITFLLILFLLSLEGLRVAEHGFRACAEARFLVGSVLASRKASADAAALFRRARKLDPAHDRSGCERGLALDRQGQWALAADAFRACIAADPEEASAHYVYAQDLFKAYGPKFSIEVRSEFRRFAELAKGSSATIDPAVLREAGALVFDLEDLLGQSVSARRNRYTVDELLEILSRPQERGHSRYEGPRLPLQLGFRPEDTELGKAAEEQLLNVARALQDEPLARARIRIEGNTDSVEGGSNAARVALSLRRSEVVERFLVHRCHIQESRLIPIGLADTYPLTSNETQEGRTANRRVELVNLEDKKTLRMDVRDSH